MRILFVSFNNNFTGSSYVFYRVAKHFGSKKGIISEILMKDEKNKGFLIDLQNVKIKKTISFKILPLKISYFLNQLIYFFYILRCGNRYEVIYINTILNLGAIFAAAILGKKTYLHFHEDFKNVLHGYLIKYLINFGNFVNFCPSFYTKQKLNKFNIKSIVTGNPIEDYNLKAKKYIYGNDFIIGMACSPRIYKGPDSFILIAKKLKYIKKIKFILYLNEKNYLTEEIIKETKLMKNIKIIIGSKGIKNLIKESNIILNLSKRKNWIETFGLTLASSIKAGRPVIGPIQGGHLDFVEENKNGYLIDNENEIKITKKIIFLYENPSIYERLSKNAYKHLINNDLKFFKKLEEKILKNQKIKT